jgi:hypothetical protein
LAVIFREARRGFPVVADHAEACRQKSER